MGHKRPRGHSNVYAEETVPYFWMDGRRKVETGVATGKASIPLIGGASVETCRPLPPLALSREEWEEIGRRMGWLRRKLPRKA